MPRTLAARVPFDEALICNQDTDLMLRLEAEGVEIVMLPEPLSYYDNDRRPARVSVDIQPGCSQFTSLVEAKPWMSTTGSPCPSSR